jgi:guanylate kinase
MIILITGPSGAGKSSFIDRLMAADPRLAFSVSTTTRPVRAGEVAGEDYDFVDDEAFDRLLAEDAFVEWATVHGNRYGTRREVLAAMTAEGRIPVLDIDVQGGLQVIPQFGPELVSVFLFPPSWIVNDELDEAVGRMQAVIEAAPCRRGAWPRPPLEP